MIGDTIVATASPPGAAARAVLRISGPAALTAAGVLLGRVPRAERAAFDAAVPLLGHDVACLVLVMPAPRSYTGEDVVELHLPGSPLLLEMVAERLRAEGAVRDATPGEFTRRAFTNGRLDLAEAEAVLELIHAAGEAERRAAVGQLRGGLGAGVEQVRARIQDALALLESGLDFTDGETGAVEASVWLPLLATASEELERLAGTLPAAAAAGEIVLLGAANAGKSSLCNALAGGEHVLVSPRAGTTRDVIAVEVAPGVTLLDGPGDRADAGGTDVDRAALALRDRIAARAAAALLVVDGTAPGVPRTALPVVAVVVTKADLGGSPPLPDELPRVPTFAVSSVTGEGVATLRAFLAGRGGRGPTGRGRRLTQALATAREALRRAAAAAPLGDELVAVELAAALSALADVHGRASPEDVLDRIFAAFCLGK